VQGFLTRVTDIRIELMASSMSTKRSTTELIGLFILLL